MFSTLFEFFGFGAPSTPAPDGGAAIGVAIEHLQEQIAALEGAKWSCGLRLDVLERISGLEPHFYLPRPCHAGAESAAEASVAGGQTSYDSVLACLLLLVLMVVAFFWRMQKVKTELEGALMPKASFEAIRESIDAIQADMDEAAVAQKEFGVLRAALDEFKSSVPTNDMFWSLKASVPDLEAFLRVRLAAERKADRDTVPSMEAFERVERAVAEVPEAPSMNDFRKLEAAIQEKADIDSTVTRQNVAELEQHVREAIARLDPAATGTTRTAGARATRRRHVREEAQE